MDIHLNEISNYISICHVKIFVQDMISSIWKFRQQIMTILVQIHGIHLKNAELARKVL